MKGENLGELEELVLLTVGVLHGTAYGVAIMDEIESRAGRKLNISAVHSVLKRMERKGFVKSHMGGATSDRGGRRKRLFELTPLGKRILDGTAQLRIELYNNLQRAFVNS